MSITRRGFLRGLLAGIAAAIAGRKVTVAPGSAPDSGQLPPASDYFFKGGEHDHPAPSLWDRAPVCNSHICYGDCYFFCEIRDGPRDEVGEPMLTILSNPL